MFSSFVSWFDSLPFIVVLMVWVVLLLFETVASKILKYDAKDHQKLYIYLWQIFGVFLPAMWLLRAVENYYQIVPVGAMIIFFGIYKPARLQTSVHDM